MLSISVRVGIKLTNWTPDHVLDETNGLLQAFANGSVALIVPSQITNSLVEVARLEGIQVSNPRGFWGYIR